MFHHLSPLILLCVIKFYSCTESEVINPVLSIVDRNSSQYLFTFTTRDLAFYSLLRPNKAAGYLETNSDHGCRFYHGQVFSPQTGHLALTICPNRPNQWNIYSTALLGNGAMFVIRSRDHPLSPDSDLEHTKRKTLVIDTEDEVRVEPEETEEVSIRFESHILFSPHRKVASSGECIAKHIPQQHELIRLTRETKAPKRIQGEKVYDIETSIFVDPTLTKKYSGIRRELERFILALLNEVQLIYNFDSMKTRIRILIKKIEYLNSQHTAPNDAGGDIDKYLDNFCAWQKRMWKKAAKHDRWDHALMLTGLDLYKKIGFKKNTKVLGLAWVNGMCKVSYSCTVNEAKNFESSFVIAHELAHSLGILHDGFENNCDKEAYIMSEKTGRGKIHWSPCSNKYLENFLKNSNTKCLEQVTGNARQYLNSPFEYKETMELPGIQYTLNRQCQLALGGEYRAYFSNKSPFNNVCQELWCSSGTWATQAHPALEGSNCGMGKSCYQGSCVANRELVNTAKISSYYNRHRKPTQTSATTTEEESKGGKNNSTTSSFMKRVQSFLRSTVISITKIFSG